jgi:hypothetical protein
MPVKPQHQAEPVQPTNQSPKKRRARGRPFVKNDARIKQNIEAARNGPIELPPPVFSDATLYEDMKHVRQVDSRYDRTESQRDARRWKKENLREFLKTFADLEKAHLLEQAEAQRATVSRDTVEVDVGSEKVLALIESMIGKARKAAGVDDDSGASSGGVE